MLLEQLETSESVLEWFDPFPPQMNGGALRRRAPGRQVPRVLLPLEGAANLPAAQGALCAQSKESGLTVLAQAEVVSLWLELVTGGAVSSRVTGLSRLED